MKTFLLAAVLIPCWAWGGQAAPSDKQIHEDAEGFSTFSGGLLKYMKVRNSVETSLRHIKRADSQENIYAYQQELAKGIRKARPNAHRGDIFTSDASNAIRRTIHGVFQGAQGGAASATIQQGEPLRQHNLRVNRMYPDPGPYTTVPPTLLMMLPPLPDGLAYRVVGRDLILLDVTASLLVDYLPQVLP